MWSVVCFLAFTGAVLIPKGCKNVTVCDQLQWSEWTTCSQSCGGGSQTRKRDICGLPEWGEEEVEDRCWKPLRIEHRFCNTECLNDGMYVGDVCTCKPGKTGICCENEGLMSLGSLAKSKEKASLFLRESGSRSKRDDHIDEECRETGSCTFEEVNEWIHYRHIHKSVCQWMKDRRCSEKGCGSGYLCYTTNADCSNLSHYQVGCSDINECNSSPCMHGGTCHNLVNRFTCSCPDGYNGARCEYDINECNSSPCMHGGTCHNFVNRFTCSCPDGYNGARCEYDINECSSNPCMHGGTCHNLVNRFTCSCPDGYNGARCEYDINECSSNPCMHGGTCHNLVNRFTCSCPDEYYGTRCEYEKCTESPNIINCPDGVQELNFTKLTENITFSSFDHLPGIYGQSCDGERLAVNFPETELTWSREIQTITLTANDNRGHSTSCVLSVEMKDMIPPSFLDCPSVDIVQYGSNGGSLVTWSPIHAEDNSGNVTVSSSNSNGEFMKFGSHLISYNAADEFGNTNQCNFTVTVKKLPKSVCDIPPQVFHGVISCHDGHTLSCGIDRCEPGYLQTNTTNHVCSNGIWKPQFSAEFASSSCIKPEPTHLERNYTFRFTCPNLKFNPIALRDCIQQSDLCPTGDILLCDKPFQRIEGKHLASNDLQIWTTLEGILPYEANRNDLINRMDRHGHSIIAYFKNGNFKQTCHQLKCHFEDIKADPLREVCVYGTVEFIIHGKRMCRKCGPGWFYDGGDCVQCSEGFYQDQYGQSGCKKCPDGTTSVMGTFIKSRCFVKVIVEKQTSSFHTLTIVGISISGSLLIVFIVLIVMVNKWRMSANRTKSDNKGRTEEHAHHTAFDETLSEVYDEIKEDRVYEGYINHKLGKSDKDGEYESLPGRRRVENPYTIMSWRNY
ncbi:uncharacterized protein LOC130046342 isoform X2 [Ostrea edulis]|uniref:uncharacterized protein LOC130046342 isoform X2 n=1 Tax=Ostrea edulis TaxID=37623 RepID=UPI0024AF80C3|nr:uncharacterized protein LOC130046342 isoform X2 [Ostrea edulis]